MYIEMFGTSINWLAQLFDIVGFVIIAIAYQQKKNNFLITSMAAYCCFIAESLSLLLIGGINTYANIIVTGVSIIRNIIMIIYSQKLNREMPKWIALVLLVATWGANVFFFGAWYTYIPCVFLTIYTFSAIQKNYYILKVGAMLLEGSYILYNFETQAYFGAVREIVLVLCIAVSIIIMARKQHILHKTQLSSTPITTIKTSSGSNSVSAISTPTIPNKTAA